MEIRIEAAGRQPIYRQIVAAGPRSRRPRADSHRRSGSPRSASFPAMLVVNPNTVARAYSELERDGILNTRQGLGVFIAAPKNELTKKARKERLLDLLDRLLTEAVCLGFSADEVATAVDERVKRFQWATTGSAP